MVKMPLLAVVKMALLAVVKMAPGGTARDAQSECAWGTTHRQEAVHTRGTASCLPSVRRLPSALVCRRAAVLSAECATGRDGAERRPRSN